MRLVVQLPQRLIKAPLRAGELTIGSGQDCDVRIAHPTVSRRHARLEIDGDDCRLTDLQSSNGTKVDGRRVRSSVALGPSSQLAFGSVRGWIEEVRAGDLEPAVALPVAATRTEAASLDGPAPPAAAGPRRHTTLSASALEDFALSHLPRLLGDLRARRPASELARELGATLFTILPCVELEIYRGSGSRQVLWFSASADRRPEDSARLERRDGGLSIGVTFFPAALAGAYAPLVDCCLDLLALADRSPGSAVPRQAVEPPPLPRPTSVDPRMLEIYQQAAKIARSDVSVLIEGESGTGKEVLARYLHAASGRPGDRFVALNCAALPSELLEAELFGIEQGVATGVDARAGKFEQADGGTLFLDEIGDMALATQAKILRVLQEREVFRLGAKQARSAEVRVLAATNRDVDAMVRSGSFRGDLYHRIAGWEVTLPPLRRRAGDIVNLAAHFLAQEAGRRGAALAGLSHSAAEALVAWHWPGNIRELQREIARASLFLDAGELLESSHLREAIRRRLDQPEPTLKEVLESTERRQIENALQRAGGDTAAAAGRLAIGRSTLYRRMKALGVQDPDEAAD